MRPSLYTFGYGNLPITEFFNQLKHHRIEAVIDVRSNPHRTYDENYQQKNLITQVLHHQMSYSHAEHLGGRLTNPQFYQNGQIQYDFVQLSPVFHSAILTLVNLLNIKSTCIICACKSPLHCHRCLLIGDYIVKKDLAEVYHIQTNNTLKTQAECVEEMIANLKLKPNLIHNRKEIRTIALAKYREKYAFKPVSSNI